MNFDGYIELDKLKNHPYNKEIFLDLIGDEFDDLFKSIKERGLITPIIIDENNTILSGHQRARVYKKLKIKKIEYNKKEGLTDEEKKEWLISDNLNRRQLTEFQEIECYKRLKEIEENKAKVRQETSNKSSTGNDGVREKSPQANGKARDKAADKVSKKTKKKTTGKTYDNKVKKEELLKKEDKELFNQFKKGILSLNQAIRKLKEKEREKERQQDKKKAEKVKSPKEIFKEVKFTTIVIDPPWDLADEGDNNQLGRAKQDYASIPFEELKKLPINDLMKDDSHIYLWITNRSLPKGFELLKEWGFRYIVCLTWCKPSFGMGNYFRGSTEQVLFGVKGSLSLKRKDVGTWFEAKRGDKKHSSKPDEFYKLVESCSPGLYLDYFGRKKRKGWYVYGNL